MTNPVSSLVSWAKRHFPTRESLEKNRYIRPFAHRVLRADLWRFNRRSVPRAIALGVFAGILVPFAHSFVAAVTAVVVRANVPVAIASTWISNPLTWLLIFPGAYKIGAFLLHIDALTKVQPLANTMATTGTDQLLTQLTGKGLELAFGLFVEASVLASLGYLLSSFGWRWWIGRKLQQRRKERQQRQIVD
ncbi:MAG: hypothetical protein RLY97_146 [Pseudomonadota bacterium]|jgi:uncharacterized protein (DUF2062 family)